MLLIVLCGGGGWRDDFFVFCSQATRPAYGAFAIFEGMGHANFNDVLAALAMKHVVFHRSNALLFLFGLLIGYQQHLQAIVLSLFADTPQ